MARMPCLSSGLPEREALRPLVHDEPGRAAGGVGQDRVEVGDAAVADPLLAAGDPVADDLAVLLDRDGRGRQRPEVAAGLRLGGAVGEEVPVLGERPIHSAFCSGVAADVDRVGAEEGGENAGRDAEVDRGHGLGHPVDVVGAAAEAAELLRDDQQVEADLLRVVEVLHDLLGKLVPELDLQQLRRREVLLRVLPERRQDLVEHLGVESRHGAPYAVSDAPRSFESGGGTTAAFQKTPNRTERPNPTETTPSTECVRFLILVVHLSHRRRRRRRVPRDWESRRWVYLFTWQQDRASMAACVSPSPPPRPAGQEPREVPGLPGDRAEGG